MSRNTKIVVGVILAIGVTAGAWSVFGGQRKPAKQVTSAAVAGATEATSSSVALVTGPATANASAPARTAKPRTVGKAVDVTWYKLLSPKEMRPNESPASQELRQQMDTKLTGFFETTKLPEVYQKRTLDTLADMQAEYEALDEQIREISDPGAYKDAIAALNRNTVDELARFMSPDQLNALDNAIGLETLHMYVAAKPFDLKTEPTK